MSRVIIRDKTFKTSIPEAGTLERVKQVADRISKDFEGKIPLFLVVLNGSFMHTSDLMKHITIPCEVSFVRLASYQGVTSTSTTREVIGLNENIRGREVITVEDIAGTGVTMRRMLKTPGTRESAGLHITTLLLESGKLTAPLSAEYAAIEIPNSFIIGYEFDYDQEGCNLRDTYILVQE